MTKETKCPFLSLHDLYANKSCVYMKEHYYCEHPMVCTMNGDAWCNEMITYGINSTIVLKESSSDFFGWNYLKEKNDMNKIRRKVKSIDIFTTTDDREHDTFEEANNHQIILNREEIAVQIEDYITNMYNIPTQEEIDDLYEEEDKWGDADALEEKRNKFYDKMAGVFKGFEIDECAETFIDMWQSFGEENIQKIFMFINSKLGK